MSVQWTWLVPVGLGLATLVGRGGVVVGWRTRTDGLAAVAHSARLTALPRYQVLARRHRHLLVAMSAPASCSWSR